MTERRLLRAMPFDLTAKLARLNWVFVLLLCALAGGRLCRALQRRRRLAAARTRTRQALRFALGLVLMLGIALIDIRFIARLAWPAYGAALALLVLVVRIGHVGKGAQRWIDSAACSCSRRS